MTLTERPPTERPLESTDETRGNYMPQIVGGGVLVFIGALWLLERVGSIDISVTAVLALATMVTGISLMLLANHGSHRDASDCSGAVRGIPGWCRRSSDSGVFSWRHQRRLQPRHGDHDHRPPGDR